jgi:Helix-turn-helix domain
LKLDPHRGITFRPEVGNPPTGSLEMIFGIRAGGSPDTADKTSTRRFNEDSMSTQPGPVNPVESPPASVEPFVDPDTAAHYLHTTRRHVLEMVREGLIPGHPLDPHAKKKDWRFLLSELHAYMLSCDQRPPGAHKPSRRV